MPKPRIMIVDDDPIIRKFVRANMDGFEVCRRLRKWSQTPVILLSARGEVSETHDCNDNELLLRP
jgi:DNA-binding response OmpR family regulator